MPPLAVDTNVLARALVEDGSDQTARALQCLRDNQVLVLETVLLETEWLLRSRLKLPRSAVNDLFSKLLTRPNVLFEDKAKVAEAVVAHREGFDFADALHLFNAQGCEALLSFDRDFARRAANVPGLLPVREP
ncbi:type II toxin-antitoxin system VapC family toxin [Chelativorans alearense]|uniref:type II toxin-antitoxin system VapC family toxin n=1 Tax=Chelativorans alearense TaxID=2681495 RepID=UPI0013D1D190|nr:type II toxin-antitoxin system VapC family toxin [Chelativorans alearense]